MDRSAVSLTRLQALRRPGLLPWEPSYPVLTAKTCWVERVGAGTAPENPGPKHTGWTVAGFVGPHLQPVGAGSAAA